MKYYIYKSDSDCTEDKRFQGLRTTMQIDGKFFPVGCLPERAAQLYPHRIALQDQVRTLSFQQLYSEIQYFAKALQTRGIGPGQRILLLYQNSIEFFVAYYAILHLGAVAAPLNSFLTMHELQHIVTDAQPEALLAGEEQKNVLDQQLGCPVWYHSGLAQIASAPVIDYALDPVRSDEDDLSVLLYTSGTTGSPKGVMLSSKNIMNNMAQALCRLRLNVDGSDRILAILPLFHSFAQLTSIWAAFYVGCGIIVVPKIDRRALSDALILNPTIFVGVPALYGLLCLMKNAPLDSIRYFLSGGDVLPDKIRLAFALLYGRKIISGYGLTEASPLVSFVVTNRQMSANNIGVPVAGLCAVIRDKQGQEVASGAVGELWVRGDNVMLGYYRDPWHTQDVLQEGWLKTGDLAYWCADGTLAIAGRSKDLIIHKGFNIYPAEIENVLLTHADVRNAAVVGIELESSEQIPVAFIYAVNDNSKLPDELAQLCKKALAFYKAPRKYVIFHRPLPQTATGKVDKEELLAIFNKKKGEL